MRTLFALGLCAGLAVPVLTAQAQVTLENPVGQYQLYELDSGVLRNVEAEPKVVFEEVIRVRDANWIRVYFGETELSRGSFLRVTSLLDGEVQELDWSTLRMWSFSTAYFNGDAVQLELVAAPNGGDNRVTVHELAVEMGGADRGSCGICGSDNRTPSDVDAFCRVMPVGCSATVVTEGSCLLTAGHCVTGGSADVVQFNVPPSFSNCNLQNPPVSDQFPVTFWDGVNGGVGNDWAVMTPGTNNLGQLPFDRYGEVRPVRSAPANNGQTIQNWGYGIDSQCTRTQTQQFHQGPIVGRFGGYYAFSIDITFGNSGSGVFLNNEIIGVVSHCSTSCSPQQNIATRVDLSQFANAIEAICDAEPLVNDDCSAAVPFNDGNGDGVIAYSTLGATTDGPDNPAGQCNDFDQTQTHNDIWYTYEAQCSGTLTITTCNDLHGQGEPTYDTDLAVYGPYGSEGQINCNSLNFLACNDDDPNNPCGTNPPYSSTIEVDVTEGDVLLVRVGGWSADDSGDGFLSIECDGVSGGACCFSNGSCAVLDQTACETNGGVFQGGGTTCADVQCPQPPACDGDIDNNDTVDVSDLLAVLSAWGPCNDCPEDLDGNNVVDVADLLTLLANWGPCDG